MEVNDERALLPIPETARRRNTAYRWVIVALFSVLGVLQMAVWITWPPISISAAKVIGFTSHDHDLLINWLPIGIIVTAPLLIWMINTKGARLPVVISSIVLMVGTGVRCLPLTGKWRKFVIHIGQFVSAMTGSAAIGMGPLLSNMWFPPEERVLATSCMVGFGNIGSAASFLIGPAVVELPNNCSLPPANGTSNQTLQRCVNNSKKIRNQIDHYMYGEFGAGVLVCILIVLLFRNKPKEPPSASAAVQRLDALAGLKSLSKNYSWWAACLAVASINGLFFGWSGVITVILTRHGISERTADTAGLAMTCTGVIMGTVVGWFSDRIKGRLKWPIVGCFIGMFISLLYLVIIVMKWIDIPPFQFTVGGLWASYVLYGTLQMVAIPLEVELLVDTAYPVSEGTTTSITLWASMIFMFVYLLILNAVKNQDVANYFLLAVIAAGTPLFALSATNRNNRLSVDKEDADRIDSEAAYLGPGDHVDVVTDNQISAESSQQPLA